MYTNPLYDHASDMFGGMPVSSANPFLCISMVKSRNFRDTQPWENDTFSVFSSGYLIVYGILYHLMGTLWLPFISDESFWTFRYIRSSTCGLDHCVSSLLEVGAIFTSTCNLCLPSKCAWCYVRYPKQMKHLCTFCISYRCSLYILRSSPSDNFYVWKKLKSSFVNKNIMQYIHTCIV